MLTLPFEQAIETIEAKAGISKEEIQARIDKKLEELSGLISKEGAAMIVANELGIKLMEQSSGRLQIKNIVGGMRSLEIAGKVLQKYDVREFTSGDRQGKVGSCLVGDETGTIRFVFWGGQTDHLTKFNEGDVVSVEGGYVKDNQGRQEIHVNEKATCMINPEGVIIGDVAQSQPTTPIGTRKQINELSEQDLSAEIMGAVVQAYEPRFFERKNTAQPETSYVLNALIDDGSETIRTAFFAQQAAELLNKSHEEMMALREQPQNFEDIKNELLGSLVKISGRVKKNDMFDRIEFIARNVSLNPDAKEELSRLQNA